LLGRLPLPVLNWLGIGIGELMWRLRTRECRVAEINLALCYPSMSPHERRELAHQSVRDFGCNAAEMLHVWFSSPQRALDGIGPVEGEHVMREALAAGRGVIVLGPHFGNWEWLGIYLGRHYRVTNMYLPAKKNLALAEAVLAARSRDGASVAPADASGVRTVLRTLKEGRVVGILPDQEPKHAGAEFAPFFGQPALTMTLVANLLQRTGARAVFAAAIRQRDGHRYRLVFRAPDPALYDPDLATSLAALNRGVENLVAEAPAQYQWVYKRFKSQPDGWPDPYAALKQSSQTGAFEE
jgi:KDO2-lipid IV(A) lauroyltransferase